MDNRTCSGSTCWILSYRRRQAYYIGYKFPGACNGRSLYCRCGSYNTYKREGFPIGAIGNPGLDALLAAVNPSEDETIKKCYYFATDYKTGITYFSKTYTEHQAVIQKYGITDIG